MNFGDLIAKGSAVFLKKKLSAMQAVFDAGTAPEKAAFQASVSGGGVKHLGIVATKCVLPTNHTFSGSGSAKQFMTRSTHIALEPMTSIKLRYDNWVTTSDTELVSSGAAYVQASIEYPLGTIHATALFSAAGIGTIPIGGFVLSDYLTVTIPKGARFAVRTFLDAPAGAPYSTDGLGGLARTADGCSYGVTTPNLVSTPGAVTNTAVGLCYRPTAILQMTSMPTVGLIGDSRNVGSVESVNDLYGGIGQIQRLLSGVVPFVGVAASGSSLFGAAGAGHSRRMAIVSAYCTHVISNFGTNDIFSGRYLGAFKTNMDTVRTTLGLPIYQATIGPCFVTSIDSYATVAGQTVSANDAQRVAINEAIRGGDVQSISGYIEIADYVESSRNSGKWKADGVTPVLYTGDGTHESQFANRQIQSANPGREVILPLLCR